MFGLLLLLVLSGCQDPEPPDPAALIPDWRTYYNREIGIEFNYPYTLRLDADTTADDQLDAKLLWVGNEVPVFQLATRAAESTDEGSSNIMVGGKRASQTMQEIDGEEVQQTTVEHRGRQLVFTGEGSTFDKVLNSVKFIE